MENIKWMEGIRFKTKFSFDEDGSTYTIGDGFEDSNQFDKIDTTSIQPMHWIKWGDDDRACYSDVEITNNFNNGDWIIVD